MALQILTNTPIPQNGDGCSFLASGTTAFTQREIDAKAVKYQDTLCPRTLEAKWTQILLKNGQKYSEADIPAKIVDGTIVNADINASSAIAVSKIAATGTSNQVLRMNTGATALEFATVSSDFVLLATTTASNVTTLDINGYFTSSYDVYKLFIYNLYQGSSPSNFNFRVATTGSYTVQTGNDYYGSHVYARKDSGSATLEHAGDWGGSTMVCGLGGSATSSAVTNIEITIFNPLSTSVKKKFNVHSNAIDGDITVSRSLIGGEYWNSTTAVTGLRFISSAGNNFTGTFKLYGIKN